MTTVVKKQRNNVRLELADYININSGECLTDELDNSDKRMTITEEGRYVILKSDNYTIVDSDAIAYLNEILSRAEYGSVAAMMSNLKTPLNIIYNNNIPHTNLTLQKYLGYASESKFITLIRKLMKLGILYQIKGKIMGDIRVIYMFNPFIARKRKAIDKEVVEIFDGFINSNLMIEINNK